MREELKDLEQLNSTTSYDVGNLFHASSSSAISANVRFAVDRQSQYSNPPIDANENPFMRTASDADRPIVEDLVSRTRTAEAEEILNEYFLNK